MLLLHTSEYKIENAYFGIRCDKWSELFRIGVCRYTLSPILFCFKTRRLFVGHASSQVSDGAVCSTVWISTPPNLGFWDNGTNQSQGGWERTAFLSCSIPHNVGGERADACFPAHMYTKHDVNIWTRLTSWCHLISRWGHGCYIVCLKSCRTEARAKLKFGRACCRLTYKV